MNTKQDENDVHSVTQDVMNTKQDENDVHNVTQDVLNTKQDGNDVHNVTQDVLDFKQDVLQHTGDVLHSTRHVPQVPFQVTEGVDYETIFTEGPLPVSATRLDIGSCQNDTVPVYSGHLGEIQGVLGPGVLKGVVVVCVWKIMVPDHLFLSVLFDVLEPCDSDTFHVLSDDSAVKLSDLQEVMSCYFTSRLYIPFSNEIRFNLTHIFEHTREEIRFRVRFMATKESLRHRPTVHYTTSSSGYVTTPGFDGMRMLPSTTNATYHLIVPKHHVCMLSVRFQSTGFHIFKGAAGEILKRFYLPRVFKSSLVITSFSPLSFVWLRGFKLLFSFHPVSKAPRFKMENAFTPKFDCSGPRYASFKQHLDCNLDTECQHEEDEGEHCPFSPPGCDGHVGYQNKCFVLIKGYQQLDTGTDKLCKNISGTLAMMKTRGEWEAFQNIFRCGKNLPNDVLIGMTAFDSHSPDYYRKSHKWIDNTVSYDLRIESNGLIKGKEWMSFDAVYPVPIISTSESVAAHFTHHHVCQFDAKLNYSVAGHNIQLPTLVRPALHSMCKNITLVLCPDGHVTHDFLSSDPGSKCGASVSLLTRCTLSNTETEGNMGTEQNLTVAMFTCDDESRLHYTLVCDFRKDCQDNSDEDFCEHSATCEGFTCKSGQCVGKMNVCDFVRNCVDGSDEDRCMGNEWRNRKRVPPPAVVDFQYGGDIVQRRLQPFEVCPETHFRCPGESDYCLPVFVRCNGVYDCAGHEDEVGCDNYTCPGFYRCRASSVCVHIDHLCDGVFQCPLHDDELLCDMVCPEGCHCQGLSFVCHRPFPTDDYPDLRYLDADESGMTPRDLKTNLYIIWLSLASCDVSVIHGVDLPNLQTLDLSDNKLKTFPLNIIHFYPNLRVLVLKNNPLTSLKVTRTPHMLLTTVDLSHVQLHTFDSHLFSALTEIQFLNISHGKLRTVSDAGFGYLPNLKTLDLRGNHLRHYPASLFKGLTELTKVYTDNYELCCKAFLPEQFDERFCYAPVDEMSSCEDLLRSNIYRLFLWTASLFSVSGNAGSFVYRLIIQRRTTKSGFNVFVTNLCLADFLMGVYLFVIGTADQLFKGTYILYKRSWTTSIPCKAAGFLSLLSSEVSAFMISLITLDRFIVLRFPFSAQHFTRWSATFACVMTWVVGTVLAGVPFLPITRHWDFYGQTAVCIPVPVTRKPFPGRDYSFGVMVVLNFVLFLLISVGQAFIYWSVRLNSMATETTRKSHDLTIARRLITVAVSDFLCWFPVGLLGLMTSAGIPVASEFSVFTAVIVLPLNSALNPFLYSYNVLAEKRRKAREARLLELLQSQVTSEELK